MPHHTKTKESGSLYATHGEIPGNYSQDLFQTTELIPPQHKAAVLDLFLQQIGVPGIDDLLIKMNAPSGKKSFLVFKNNKYYNVPTEKIACFYINHEVSIMKCFDQQEFHVNYSLEQLQQLLPENQFFRLNRQYVINFHAVREVEHYFARKLLVNLVIPSRDKLLVSKEKVTEFLQWLDNR